MIFKKLKSIALVLILFISTANAASVEQLIVESKALKKSSAVCVILPDSYVVEDSLPVLYLLHGYGGNQNSYLTNLHGLLAAVDQLNILVVCVNGENSWYMDSPQQKNSLFETYIISELFPFISIKYKTAKKRGVVGLSMGGYGSLYLALKHPECFAYVGSTSGGLDILPFSKQWGLQNLLGPKNDDKWKTYSPYFMLDKVSVSSLKFTLVFDCGTEDFFFEVNELFHEKLNALGLKHEYLVSEGNHNWEYWNKTLLIHLNKFCETVK